MKRITLAVDETYVGSGLVVAVTFPWLTSTKTVRVLLSDADARELLAKVVAALSRSATPRLPGP